MKVFDYRWMSGLVVALALITGAFALPAAAQQFPSKPVRFIVPYPPGGSPDALTRLIADRLSPALGQPFVVDFRAGASTIIGAEALLKSPPDGHTIMMIASTHVIIPNLLPRVPFDAINDFQPVAGLAATELILVVHPSVQAKDLKEFIALGKTNAKLNFASSSTGSPTHLAGEMFNMMAGTKMQHVPYKGAGPAVSDLLGGHVQAFFAAPVSVIQYVKGGQLRALAITGDKRFPTLPEVPTFAEAGLPGFEGKTWYGVLAPANTPEPIIDRLSMEIEKVLAIPEVKDKLSGLGLDPMVMDASQFGALMKRDMAKYANVIKAANIKMDQ